MIYPVCLILPGNRVCKAGFSSSLTLLPADTSAISSLFSELADPSSSFACVCVCVCVCVREREREREREHERTRKRERDRFLARVHFYSLALLFSHCDQYLYILLYRQNYLIELSHSTSVGKSMEKNGKKTLSSTVNTLTCAMLTCLPAALGFFCHFFCPQTYNRWFLKGQTRRQALVWFDTKFP